MRGWKSCGFVLVGAALTAGLPGCGGGSGGPTGPVIPTPAPCSHSTLLQGSAALPANVADFESFTTTATGRLDLTVDWTFSSSLIGLFVAQAPCEFDQFKAGTCRFLLQMASPPKPLKGSVSNLAAGTYEVIIANANAVPESVSASVILSSSTCPAASSFTSQSVGRAREFFRMILEGVAGSLR